MNKQEIIHLHGLLDEIKYQCNEWGHELDSSEYEELDVGPKSLYKNREDHRKAVLTLSEMVAKELEDENRVDTGNTNY